MFLKNEHRWKSIHRKYSLFMYIHSILILPLSENFVSWKIWKAISYVGCTFLSLNSFHIIYFLVADIFHPPPPPPWYIQIALCIFFFFLGGGGGGVVKYSSTMLLIFLTPPPWYTQIALCIFFFWGGDQIYQYYVADIPPPPPPFVYTNRSLYFNFFFAGEGGGGQVSQYYVEWYIWPPPWKLSLQAM